MKKNHKKKFDYLWTNVEQVDVTYEILKCYNLCADCSSNKKVEY
jgi:hypothetical protein